MPGKSMPSFNLVSADKFGHAFVYGVMALLLLRVVARLRSMHQWFTVLILLGVAGYGVLMEFVQYFFCPGRFYEYDDMLANAMGVLLGWGLWRLFFRRQLLA